MPRQPSPTILRFELGRELRRLREAAVLSSRAAAGEIEVSTPTLSKIEGGRQTVRPIYVKLLGQLYGLDANGCRRLVVLAEQANRPEWFTSFAKYVPDWFRLYLGYEGAASSVGAYDAEQVNGLLRTPAYARALLRSSRRAMTDVDLDGSVQLIRGRQDRALIGESTALHAIMNEAVVRRVVGGPGVMREQLTHLIKASELSGVTIQVLPFSAGAHPAMAAPFVRLGFDDHADLDTCYLENGRGALYLDGRADLDHYGWMFDQLAELALSPDRSRSLMADAVEAW